MKKFILPLILLSLILFYPSDSFAQNSTDCWGEYNSNTKKCSDAQTQCLNNCPKNTNYLEANKKCLSDCSNAYNSCLDQASAAYNACVEAGRQNKQPVPTSGSKELSQDKKPLSCGELSKVVSSEDCLYNVMVDFKVWCAKPGENLTEFTPDQIKLVPPNRAPDYLIDPSLTDEELKRCQKNVSQGQQTGQSTEKVDRQKIQQRGWTPFFARGWLDYFRNLWTIVSFRSNGNPFVEFVNGFGGADHTLCDPSTCSEAMEATRRVSEGETERFMGEYQQYESNVNWQSDGQINWRKFQTESVIRVTEPTIFGNKATQTFFELRPGQSNQAALKAPEGGSKLLNLEDGEVEVVKSKPGVSDSEYDGIKTPNATVVSVQTHYWVSYDKKKNQTTVAVYEGKVEVKTNDGQVTTVTPKGDKPGVVVISQKLSVTKLAAVGAVVVLLIMTVFWLVKRKNLPKLGNTGRKKR